MALFKVKPVIEHNISINVLIFALRGGCLVELSHKLKLLCQWQWIFHVDTSYNYKYKIVIQLFLQGFVDLVWKERRVGITNAPVDYFEMYCAKDFVTGKACWLDVRHT
jgi:hypothetical protein